MDAVVSRPDRELVQRLFPRVAQLGDYERSTLARVLGAVAIDAAGCWRWQKSVSRQTGYGWIRCHHKTLLAHRVSYSLMVGDIPTGLTIDHLCRVRCCVNPLHLEAVTNRENILRSEAPTAINARKTECAKGHALVRSHTRQRRQRMCPACTAESERARARAYYLQNRDAAKARARAHGAARRDENRRRAHIRHLMRRARKIGGTMAVRMLALDCESIADLTPLTDDDVLCIHDMATRNDQDAETYMATAPPLARVVLIGFVNLETGGKCAIFDRTLMDVDRRAASLADAVCEPCVGEDGLVAKAHEILRNAQGLVTFAGRVYDIPLLLLRAMRHGITPASVVQAAATQKPWESRPMIDVLNLLTFGGATRRYPLSAYTIGIGGGDIPNPKTNGDGSKVGDLVKRRDGTALATYCLADVDACVALARKAGALAPAAKVAA